VSRGSDVALRSIAEAPTWIRSAQGALQSLLLLRDLLIASWLQLLPGAEMGNLHAEQGAKKGPP
jgi:hypothetical protein